MKHPSLNMLFNKPQEFNFFQLVRILGKYSDYIFGKRDIHFKENISLSFPVSCVNSINFHNKKLNDNVFSFELLTSFMGIIGQNGILPRHYTELLIERIYNKDYALQDFLNIFYDRLISLFYETWETCHFDVNFERYQQVTNHELLSLIYAVSGQSFLNNKLEENILLFYSSLFSKKTKPSICLKLILQDYFCFPISINNHIFKTLPIEKDKISRLSVNQHCLGVNAVIGKYVWNLQNFFEVYIGPIDYSKFKNLLYLNNSLKQLIYIINIFAGWELDYIVKISIEKSSMPKFVLSGEEVMMLGCNTCFKSNNKLCLYFEINLPLTHIFHNKNS